MKDILIVDDDPHIRVSFVQILERAGYDARAASDVPSALDEVRRRIPDLVLCDVYLQGDTGGLRIVEQLRSHPDTALVLCIVMSAESDSPLLRLAVESGADDFLNKPCTDATLLAALDARFAFQELRRREVAALETRLGRFLDASTDLVLITDPSAVRILHANRAARQKLALPHPLPDAGAPLADFVAPAVAARLRSVAVPAACRDGSHLEESAFVGGDGHEFPVAWQLLVDRDIEGRVRTVAIIARDLSERRAAEDRLRLMSRALDQSPVSIVITDPYGNIQYVNPKFTEVTGYTSDEVLGRKPRILKSGETPPEEYERLWGAILAGRTWSGEFHNRRKNGELFWERASVSGICDDAGVVSHILAMKEDITERKVAEERQTLLQLQLHQAQKLESIGRLAAGIAHEINTPVQYISDNHRFLDSSFLELVRVVEAQRRCLEALHARGGLDPALEDLLRPVADIDVDFHLAEIPAALADAAEGTARVLKILRAMKDFSHPGSDEKKPVDLNRAIESTLTISRNEWKYVAELVTDLDPDLPLVPCLPGEFNQVILNLVVNAAHAIADAQPRVASSEPAKGTITVSTRTDGDWVEIRVADTGTGIPESVRSRVFEPFFTTKEVGRGTGQGLALARSIIVERHGGTLDFSTETGRGTVFTLRLPLRDLGTSPDAPIP